MFESLIRKLFIRISFSFLETQEPDGDDGGDGGDGDDDYDPNDYKPQHTKYDPNLKIYVPVYYDANSFDPNDDFVNRTFLE
jgi:hypothetical protein